MLQVDLSVLVAGYVANPSYEEIISSVQPATQKLQRIIQREGDSYGARLEPEYIAQLIAENIRQTRFSNECNQRYKEKRRAAEANAPLLTSSIVSF